MEYKLMHRSYRPTIGGHAVPSSKLINDLKEQAINYIGTFSEYNPIGFSNRMAVFVNKGITSSINQQRPFRLPGFKLKGGLGYHGSEFNNNYAISFSKEDLLRIANAMDETDTLQIAIPDSIKKTVFEKGVKEVTKIY